MKVSSFTLRQQTEECNAIDHEYSQHLTNMKQIGKQDQIEQRVDESPERGQRTFDKTHSMKRT